MPRRVIGSPHDAAADSATDRRPSHSRRLGERFRRHRRALLLPEETPRDGADRHVEHRREEQAEERHARHAEGDGGADGLAQLRAGPGRDGERNDAEDEGEARSSGSAAGAAGRPRRRRATGVSPWSSRWRANSTIRMAFLAARPISTTKAICVMMLLSMPRNHHADQRRQDRQRHDQDDRQRQAPALILRREEQEDEEHGDARRRSSPCCRRCVPGRRCPSIRSRRPRRASRPRAFSIKVERRSSRRCPAAAEPCTGDGRVDVVARHGGRARRVA